MEYSKEKLKEYESLLKELLPHIKRMARSYMRNYPKEDTEDVIQDSIMKSYMSYPRYEFASQAQFKNWMFMILRNTFIDKYKNNKRKFKMFHNSISGITDHDDYNYSLENIIENDEFKKIELKFEVESSMKFLRDKLPKDLLEVYLLDLEGYSNSEIADKLILKVSNIKGKIFRAKNILSPDRKKVR